MHWIDTVLQAMRTIGVDLHGIADGRAYRRLLPGCRSVLVLGNGGPTLWRHLDAAVRDDPTRLTSTAHPLDDFVETSLQQADPSPPPTRRWIRCAATESTAVDFRRLAHEAGLGYPSLLGLLLHPIHGPWMGLRAACFTTESLEPTGPPNGAGPCATCAAPCVRACPTAAVTPEGFDIGECAAFHLEDTRCLGTCDARRACPVGTRSAYSDLQLHYHSAHRTGRARWARALNIEDDSPKPDEAWHTWART